MTGLTEQEIKDMSEILGITEDQLLRMSEDDLLEALNKAVEDLREFVEFKKHQAVSLRSENTSLRLTNIGLKMACTARQIRIGFLRTIHDIKSLLKND